LLLAHFLLLLAFISSSSRIFLCCFIYLLIYLSHASLYFFLHFFICSLYLFRLHLSAQSLAFNSLICFSYLQ
jgi:hypothetical protein